MPAVEAVPGAPPSVLGLCSVRGTPVPAISLPALFAAPDSPLQRLVTLRIDAQTVAIAVESIIGVRWFTGEESRLPSLLGDVAAEFISAIGMLDAELLLFLRAARIAPPAFMNQLVAGRLGQ